MADLIVCPRCSSIVGNTEEIDTLRARVKELEALLVDVEKEIRDAWDRRELPALVWTAHLGKRLSSEVTKIKEAT